MGAGTLSLCIPVSLPGTWELFGKLLVDERVRTTLPATPQLGPGIFWLPLATSKERWS